MAEDVKEEPRVRLYELTERLQRIQAALEESGGILTPALEEELDAVEGDIKEKVERTLHLVRQLEGSADDRKALAAVYAAEAARLKALATTSENAAKAVKKYLLEQLKQQGHSKVETRSFKVRIQRASRPSIRWALDVKKIPLKYRKVTVEADTQLAWDDLRAGAKLPAGFTVEYSESLIVQ